MGRLREVILSQLLNEYLPSKYSFGTGFIVDSEGGRSRQSDVVIYDVVDSSNLFARTGPILFPVEATYAVIEVKTTLSAATAKDAVDQIASIKALTPKGDPTVEWEAQADGTALVERYPSPPVGVIFFFQAGTPNLDTARRQIIQAIRDIETSAHHPDLIVVIREGLAIRYQDLDHTPASLQSLTFPVIARDPQGNLQRNADGDFEGVSVLERSHLGESLRLGTLGEYAYDATYRVCESDDHGLFLADAPRLLLMFLGAMEALLRHRVIRGPRLSDYVGRYYGEGLVMDSPPKTK